MLPLSKKNLLGLGTLACLALATAVWQLSARADEVGTNDFRISDMGPDGNASYDANLRAVAYNSMNNEYLVVWWGDDNENGLVDGEQEVFGQRIDATTGATPCAGLKEHRREARLRVIIPRLISTI